jgi:hypothetical protein
MAEVLIMCSAATNRRRCSGGQLTDRNTVASDDETLASVQLTHDLAAVVRQLSLGDLACHGLHCSYQCYTPTIAARRAA